MASEKAKKYTDTVMPVMIKYADNVSYEYTEEQLQEAFDAGVESEKKKVEWHNLKENPNDLPPCSRL